MPPAIPPASCDGRADETQPAGAVGLLGGVCIFPELDFDIRIPAELPPASAADAVRLAEQSPTLGDKKISAGDSRPDCVAFDTWLPDLGIEVPASTAARAGQLRPPTPAVPSVGDALAGSGRPPSECAASDRGLRAAFARAAKASSQSSPSAAMKFGAFVRADLDATPMWKLAASATSKLFSLDPHGKAIETLEAQLVAVHRETDALKTHIQQLEAETTSRIRRNKSRRRKTRYGWRGKLKDVDYWLDRWERDVMEELSKSLPRDEASAAMITRVYSLATERAAAAINKRYRKYNKGADILSASTLRRRYPSTTTTNRRGEQEKTLGEFKSKRWAQWERYRKGGQPTSSLAEGSTKMECAEEEGDLIPATQHGKQRIDAARDLAEQTEDDRKRSLFDGGLETATVQDLALEAVENGELISHEGGEGIVHVRPPVDDIEFQEDNDERMANKFFRAAGLNPYAIHKPINGDRPGTVD